MSVEVDDAGAPPSPVPSPCVSLCKLTADRSHCQGCLRTLSEIKAWRGMTADDQRVLLAVLDRRRAAAAPLPFMQRG